VAKSLRLEAYIDFILAGDIGENIANGRVLPPSRDRMETHLNKVRSGCAGTCDACRIAQAMIIVGDVDADNDALVELWLDRWRNVVEMFDKIEFRIALGAFASALREDIAAVVDAAALQRARELSSDTN